MPTKQSFKILFRSHIRTGIIFILLAAVTFGLLVQLGEYVITSQEMSKAQEQYTGIGSAEAFPPDSDATLPYYIYTDDKVSLELFTDEEKENIKDSASKYHTLTYNQIKELSKLPYVESTDFRYMTAGVSDNYLRLYEGGSFFEYNARGIIEGTCTLVYDADGTDKYTSVNIVVTNAKLIAGNLQHELPDFALLYYPGNEYMILARDNKNTALISSGQQYDTETFEALKKSGRYAFVFRFNPQSYNSERGTYELSDFLTDAWCEAIWPLDGAPENYLETDEYAPLKELVNLIDTDSHTFDVVYTDSTDMIMRFQEGSMAITQGRGLASDDNKEHKEVCIISNELSDAYDLSVGDTIDLQLGTRLFEQYKSLGALSGTRERYSPSEASVSLEIVGIYTDLDSDSAQSRNPNWCYSVNTIFVPSSLLPISESELTDHEYTPSEFSFSVKAENIESFLEEASPKIEAMGLQLIFNDGGWLNISAEYKTSVKMSILKICILSAALITTTLFISYIYVYSRKKDYAIMRALGTSTAASVRSIILPILLTSILSVGLGLAIAWLYISKNIGSNETLLSLSVFIPNTDIFSWITIICGLAIILFIFFVSSVFLHHMNTVPILILLQSNGSKKAKTAFRYTPGTGAYRAANKCKYNIQLQQTSFLSQIKTYCGKFPRCFLIYYALHTASFSSVTCKIHSYDTFNRCTIVHIRYVKCSKTIIH